MHSDKCCNAHAPTFWGCPVCFIATSSQATASDKDGYPFVVAAKQDSSPIMGWTYLLGVSSEEPDVDRRAARAFPAYLSGTKEDSAVVALPACKRRDHGGMKTVSWAATKGHKLVPNMLMEVGP